MDDSKPSFGCEFYTCVRSIYYSLKYYAIGSSIGKFSIFSIVLVSLSRPSSICTSCLTIGYSTGSWTCGTESSITLSLYNESFPKTGVIKVDKSVVVMGCSCSTKHFWCGWSSCCLNKYIISRAWSKSKLASVLSFMFKFLINTGC